MLVCTEIMSISKATEVQTEGCLSFPFVDPAPGEPTLFYADVEVRSCVPLISLVCSFCRELRQTNAYACRGLQRPRDIIVKAQNEKGEPVQLQLGGTEDIPAFICRIFQHEYDHLQASTNGTTGAHRPGREVEVDCAFSWEPWSQIWVHPP